jgi:hypothetical protein
MSPATLAALHAFQVGTMRLSRPIACVEPNSTTIRSLIVAATPRAKFLTQLPPGKALPIEESDYDRAAKSLACEAAAVKAVAAVESAGKGFLPSGKPKILFESRSFSHETNRKFDHLFPDISHGFDRSLYQGGEREYYRLWKAMILDRTAALKSTSWGKFQILGANCKIAGSPDLQTFVGAMCQSERAHLDAFCAFVVNRRLVPALQGHDWATFAQIYNGPRYAEKHYDKRIEEEYNRAKGDGSHVASR